MPSTSPGSNAPSTATPFERILPGRPVAGYQSLTTFVYRHRRHVAYISGAQLSILSSPNNLLQALAFDDDLACVVPEAKTGKLAVATQEAAWVLEPVTEGWTKIWWEKALCLRRGDPGDGIRSLSWGGDGELLVGGSRHLSLFATAAGSRSGSPAVSSVEGGEQVEERRALWSKDISSPVRWAAFSPTANIIATDGATDRLVKIWRRLSFEEGLFDHTYLPHPGAVTHMQWRPLDEGFEARRGSGKSGRHDDDPEILHTIANDGVLRIWRTGGLHDISILVLHTTVDLISAIPQSPSLTDSASSLHARYAFTMPSFHFTAAVKAAVGLQTKLSHSLEHLKEVATKEPDLIIALDGHGRMSAWGLQSIGHKRRPDTPSGLSKQAFHIAHCEDLPINFAAGENAVFETWFEDTVLNILSHGFGGEVKWWKGETEAFLSPAATGRERLEEQAAWSGLSDEVTEIRPTSGRVDTLELVSADESYCQASRWTINGPSTNLGRAGDYAIHADAVEKLLDGRTVSIEGDVDMAVVLRDHDNDRLAAQVVAREGETVRNRQLFTTRGHAEQQRFVVLANVRRNASRGCTFTVTKHSKSLEKFARFDVGPPEDSDSPMQLTAILDTKGSNRFGIVGLTSGGQLLLYHVDASDDALDAQPVLMATIETGVPRARTWMAGNDFAALVTQEGFELAIIDMRDGYVEHRQRFQDGVEHLCAMETANVLAVGHKTYVDVLAQGHYDLRSAGSTWQRVRQVSIAGLDLDVGGLAWLGDGRLAIAAGNGCYISSGNVPIQELHIGLRERLSLNESESTVGLRQITDALKQPHVVWHPDFIISLVHSGRWQVAVAVLTRLLDKVKFWSEGDPLDGLLQVPSEQLYGAQELQSLPTLDQNLVDELHQQLDEKKLPQLSSDEQAHLRQVLDAILFCAEHVRGLDNCALRFLFSWKLACLSVEAEKLETNGNAPNGTSHLTPAPEMHWREIAFAHQSTTQQPLVDILTLAYDNKIPWRTARNLGLFAWLADREALATIFESLAQSAYRVSSPPDPIDATLFFLALHKKSTLLGLWRIATWHKEQRATMNFLKRDFSVEANRTAARKNAYALMGKRRFEYAAAFFLLAEDAASATSLLAGQCGDVMLAIAVARLWAGDGSPVLKKLVEDRLLPDGDRWQASWCYSVLGDRQQAAEALVRPREGERQWLDDEPHTLALYRLLRKTESEWEWDAVLRAARLLRKMGLPLAAVDLVRGWRFMDPREVARMQHAALANGAEETAEEPAEPPSMLDDFTSPATAPAVPRLTGPPSVLGGFATASVQDSPQVAPSMLDDFTSPGPPPQQDEKAAREAKAAELLKQLKAKKEAASEKAQTDEKQAKKEPTQFKEPSADSLLDSFGF